MTSWPRRRGAAGPLSRVRLVLVTVILVAGLTAVALPARADDLGQQRRDAEVRAAQAGQAAAAISTTIDSLTARLTQAAATLQTTQAQLLVTQGQLASAQRSAESSRRAAILVAAQLADAQALATTTMEAIASDAAHSAQAAVTVGQIAREAYRGESVASGLAVALGAANSQDFIDRFTMVSTALRVQSGALTAAAEAAAVHRNDQARLIAVTTRIAQLKVEADARAAQAMTATADAAARQAEMAQLIVDQTAAQTAVASLKTQAEAEQVAIDAQRATIAAELARIIAAQVAAQPRAVAPRVGQATSCGLTAGPAPETGLPVSIGPFRGQQLINAAQIIIAGNDLGVDGHGQVLAMMTAIGESDLVDVDHGDAAGPDSRGLFQQRANGAWGSYADRMDPRIAASNFFRALLRVTGWESMAPTLAAHLVQRNANPTYYTPYVNDAVQIVAALGGDPTLSCR